MTVPWESLANDHILGIAPYEPGKPVEELERELGIHDAIKLASNENPLPPSEQGAEGGGDALATLNRYPDGSGYYLREALARRHDVTAAHVVLGNGSNELIEMVVRAFLRPGDEAVIPHPSFVVYPMVVQAMGGIRVVVTLKDYRLDLEGDGAGDHPHDQDGLHRQSQQPDRHHRHRRRGRGLHGPGARTGSSWCSTRRTASSRQGRTSRTPAVLRQGRKVVVAAHLLQGGQPRRAAGRATRWPIRTACACSTASGPPST